MKWNGMGTEWNGNGMEWNGMEWNGMEWNGMNRNVLLDTVCQQMFLVKSFFFTLQATLLVLKSYR